MVNFVTEIFVVQSGIDVTHNKVYNMCDVNLLQYPRSNPADDLCNNFLSHGLFPSISKPARTTATSATVTDNIVFNDQQYDSCSCHKLRLLRPLSYCYSDVEFFR